MLTNNQTLQKERYRIVSQFGQFEAGRGYLALDSNTGQNVFLHETPDETFESDSAQAEMVKTLKHPVILSVYDLFAENDRCYSAMEHFEGQTFSELLEKRKSAFPIKNVAIWADGLLDALNYLHTQNPPIVHGNLKPQTIRLNSQGKLKFPVVNILQAGAENGVRNNQTFDTAVLPYLPIEQIWSGLDVASQKVILSNYDDKSAEILQKPLDVQSDVYALGATLYHLITGRIPADALTRSIDMLEGKADPLTAPHKLIAAIPPEVSEVLMRALQIKRENRFSSASIMRQFLRKAFVNFKEREARIARASQEAIEPAALETPKANPPTAPLAAPQAVEVESEQVRQLELIKRQLREAEALRLEAEKRAAEAEKRLLEREAQHISDPPVEPVFKPVENPPPAPVKAAPVTPQIEPVVSAVNSNVIHDTSDNFGEMFSQPENNSKSFVKVAAGLIVLLALGGGIWGFMNYSGGKAPSDAVPNVSQTSQTISSDTTIPAATPENQPPPQAETLTETPTVKDDSLTSETVKDATKPTDNPAASKLKPTPTPPQQAKKQPSPTPKTPEQKKKSVTLDDLLKDN